ncbi:MAG: response regulator [Chloroflexi bacterium]|nr:response regulator [Chloroflexota bacterium]
MTEQAKLSKKKVLVADDDPSIIYSVKRVLGNSYSVIEASNGEEAVNLSQRHKPDIILMDMMMPKKDGITACAEIKANQTTNAIPIVMLTGVGYQLNKDLAASTGASGYITKPFKPQELLDTISNFI